MIKINLRTLLALMFCATAGCSAIHDTVVEQEMSVRNFVLAQKAWGEWSWCYEDLDYPLHFAKGFKDGYRNILEGGNGCQPTLPPKCYWKPQFQSPEGRCKTTAWFDGFSHGALAAQQDGYGSLQEIPISPTARANLMTRLSTPAAFPFQGMSTPSVPAPDSMIEVPRQMPDTQLQQAIPLPTIGDGESLNGPAVPPVRSYEE